MSQFNDAPLGKVPSVPSQTSTEGNDFADLEKVGSISELRELYKKSPEPGPIDGWTTGIRLTPRQKKILELWGKKFEELFEATNSTAERLKILEDAPYGHFANSGVLERNHTRGGRAMFQTIQKAQNEEELKLIKEWIGIRHYKTKNISLTNTFISHDDRGSLLDIEKRAKEIKEGK